jgi:hypothetical protein
VRPGDSDNDEMGTQAYFVLLRYEPDPELRARWLDGWNKSFEQLGVEQGAWWDLVNAAVGAPNATADRALRWLHLAPVDLIRWTMHNSQRLDLLPAPAPYTSHGSIRSDGLILPYDERRTDRWNTDQFQVDGGLGAMYEMDGADVLAPYWMARYYGFIAPE